MKRSLNLMSQRARQREQLRRGWRIWSRVLSAVGILLVAVGIAEWQRCRREAQHHYAAEARYEPVRQLKAENANLRKQIQSLRAQEQVPLALAEERPLLGLIGFVGEGVAAQDHKSFVQQLEIERDPLATSTENQPRLTFALRGTTIDGTAITQFAETLRENGPFATVDLTTNRAPQSTSQTRQTFSIQGTH